MAGKRNVRHITYVCPICAASLEVQRDTDEDLAKQLRDLKGEANTLAGIIRDCDALLETIEPENDEEAERLSDLRTAITYALDPYKREGTLI